MCVYTKRKKLANIEMLLNICWLGGVKVIYCRNVNNIWVSHYPISISSSKFKCLPTFSDRLGSHKVRKEWKRCQERVNIVRKEWNIVKKEWEIVKEQIPALLSKYYSTILDYLSNIVKISLKTVQYISKKAQIEFFYTLLQVF